MDKKKFIRRRKANSETQIWINYYKVNDKNMRHINKYNIYYYSLI